MKKVTIRPVILPCKALADGSHKIRISVAHNSNTRYIVTNYSVPKQGNFKRGEVCGVSNAAYINRKLREMINELYAQCEDIDGIQYLSCSELVDRLTKEDDVSSDTFEHIYEMWENRQTIKNKPSSIKTYKNAKKAFLNFFGENFHLSLLSSNDINRYTVHLKKEGFSNDYINFLICTLRRISKYACRHMLISYRIDPFLDFATLPKTSRDIALSVEDLRTFMRLQLTRSQRNAQKFFMLSFYLCGMNIGDIATKDLSNQCVRFRRRKNESRRKDNEWTTFTIPEEARTILNDESVAEAINNTHTTTDINNLTSNVRRSLETIRGKHLSHVNRLITYSARKTWSQFAAELGVQDCVIEYCLGDVSNKGTIGYYRKVSREMADEAIGRVISFVRSGMSLKEYKEHLKTKQE